MANPFRGKKGAAKKTVTAKPTVVADHQMDVEEVIAAAAPVDSTGVVGPVPVATKRADFRELPEPERTLKRVETFLLDQRFTHGEHAAGALLILAFKDVPADEARLISVRQLLSDARGFSATTRSALLKHMKEYGLMEEISFKQKVGTEIKLTF